MCRSSGRPQNVSGCIGLFALRGAAYNRLPANGGPTVSGIECLVGLFVTCLVDLMRPAIGFAAMKLLEAAGCEVVVPETQTCCGQPG